MESEQKISEWLLDRSDISVTDEVIGRGAFGEVRVARWRGIDVACKKLHTSTEYNANSSEIVEGMKKEMELLSKLRHPNLVLFLGVCSDSSAPNDAHDAEDITQNKFDAMILTELMTCSLYDIVEVHKIELSLPEILDISLDISYGLCYLHDHNPSIIHRDISAKNILIGGNKAKIADLGQAKVFGSSQLSRQTSMPGAMAYSAPEVLTGKYSAKIDVFSVGVLLIQLASGEYPRIEKRDEQLESACAKHPPLATLMRTCVSFLPSDRPDIADVAEQFKHIKSNDRFYPPARRLPPQNDMSVLARKWMNQQIEQTCGEVNMKYELTSKQLAIEQKRWLDEAAEVDRLRKMLKERDDSLAVELAASDGKVNRIAELEKNVAELSEQLSTTTEKLKVSETDKHKFSERMKDLEVQLHLETIKVTKAKEAKHASDVKMEEILMSFAGLKKAEEQAIERERETKEYLDMQVEQNKELEARLEQALQRWRLEKEATAIESEKYIKMRSTCANLVEQLDMSTTQVAQLTSRLGQYDNLPLPDEIRARFQDMTADHDRLSAELQKLRTRNEDLLNQHDVLENKIKQMKMEAEERDNLTQKLTSALEEKNHVLSSLQSRFAAAQRDASYQKNKVAELEKENAQWQEAERIASEKLQAAEERLEHETKRMQIMSATAAQAIAEAQAQASRGHSRGRGRRNRSRSPGSGTASDPDSRPGTASETSPDSMTRAQSNQEQERQPAGEQQAGAAGDGTAGGEVRPRSSTPGLDDLDLLVGVDRQVSTADSSLNSRPVTSASVGSGQPDKEVKRFVEHAAAAGVPALVTLLKNNIESERFCWRVARALRELVVHDEALRKNCSDLQCDELLLVCLQSYPFSGMVQAQSLRLLGTLAFGNDQVRRRCGERGVMRLILNAMEKHGNTDESVLTHSCTALTNFMHNSLENRSRFLECGGVNVLVYFMDLHKTSPVIQRQIFWTVLTLSASDDACRALVDSGGASSIVNAMVHHRMDPRIQQFGCWALGNLALSAEDTRRKLRKVGALEVCRMAVEQHADDVEVLRQARQLLAVLGQK